MPAVFLEKVYWAGGSRVAAATPALVETRSGQLRAISRSKTSDNCQKLRSLRVAPDNMASTGLGMRLTTQNMASVLGLCGQRGTLNKPLPWPLLSEDEFCPSSPGLPRLVCIHLGDPTSYMVPSQGSCHPGYHTKNLYLCLWFP